MKKVLSFFTLAVMMLSLLQTVPVCALAKTGESCDPVIFNINLRIEGPLCTIFHDDVEVVMEERREEDQVYSAYVLEVIKKLDLPGINIAFTETKLYEGIDAVNGIGKVDGKIDWDFFVVKKQENY